MIKKTLKIILLLLVIYYPINSAAAKNQYEIMQQEVNKCRQIGTSQCYKSLVSLYNNNIIRYYYANALINENKYPQAKIEFTNILKSEKKNQQLIDLSKKQIEYINQHFSEMRKADSSDWGDYYNELKQTAKWKNPRQLKVRIEGKIGKENIFKQAFQLWDNTVGEISFIYVSSAQDANITCKFIDSFPDNKAGVTHINYVQDADGKTYLNKADIEIALHILGHTGVMPDANILAVTLHEIGHALGIVDHSANKNDIMYPSTATFKTTNISRRDINTVKKIYNTQ